MSSFGDAVISSAEMTEVDRRVIAVVARSLDRAPDSVQLDSRLWTDLDAESLDMLDILYGLERAFSIRMPRLNLLHRASDLFGEDVIVSGGVVTAMGMELVQRAMPEVPANWLRPNMRVYDFRQVIMVRSLSRVVQRCLDAVAQLHCPACGGAAERIPDTPIALRCAHCGHAIDVPSGEQLLVEELRQIGTAIGLKPLDSAA